MTVVMWKGIMPGALSEFYYNVITIVLLYYTTMEAGMEIIITLCSPHVTVNNIAPADIIPGQTITILAKTFNKQAKLFLVFFALQATSLKLYLERGKCFTFFSEN